MSLAKLTELGGEVVAGVMYLNREEVGRWINGEFTVMPAGETALAAAAPKARRKTAPATDPAEGTIVDPLAALDALTQTGG
jgi:hypothetical protein